MSETPTPTMSEIHRRIEECHRKFQIEPQNITPHPPRIHIPEIPENTLEARIKGR